VAPLCLTVSGLLLAQVPMAPGSHGLTLRHGGLERAFTVHVPQSYRADRPVPLVLAFHGGGGSMQSMARDSLYGLTAQSEASGWIVVFPNGHSRLPRGRLATWNAGLCCGAARDKGIDDVGFVLEVVAEVQRRLFIDPRRIFATGMSNGGMLSYRLACEASDVFRAVAAVAGTDGTPACQPGRPVPVLHIHARDDDHVLFNGGSGSASVSRTDFVSVPATIDKWARLNRCSGPAKPVLERPGVLCEVRSGCQDSAEVRLCVTDTGGHSWPGGRKARGGKGSDALDATQEIWDFFARQ
jgi:polyhydroxybutyrate depolymerase